METEGSIIEAKLHRTYVLSHWNFAVTLDLRFHAMWGGGVWDLQIACWCLVMEGVGGGGRGVEGSKEQICMW